MKDKMLFCKLKKKLKRMMLFLEEGKYERSAISFLEIGGDYKMDDIFYF